MTETREGYGRNARGEESARCTSPAVTYPYDGPILGTWARLIDRREANP